MHCKRALHHCTAAALAALVMLQTLPASAEPTLDDVVKRMETMERELRELRATVQQQQAIITDQAEIIEQRELLGGYTDAGALPTGQYPLTTVGGYIDLEFANFDNTDSDFDQHRFIVNVASQVHQQIRFYSEIEFEHGADAGEGPDGEVAIEQAMVDFELYPWLVFRAGALLVPFGRYNLHHDSDENDLTPRPLYARRIVPSTWTEAGVGFTGDVALPNDMALNYELYVINGLNDGIDDKGTRDARPSLRLDNNNNKALVGRVAVTPVPWATVGAYGYEGRWTGTNGTGPSGGFGDEMVYGYGFDLFARRGPVEFIGEYGMFDFEDADKLGMVGPGVVLDGEMHGGYAQVGYHFWPAFLDNTPLGQGFDNPTFTVVGRYDYAEIALVDADDNRQDRWTLGMNYRPIESMVFKLEYNWNDHDGDGRPLENDGEDGVWASVALGF